MTQEIRKIIIVVPPQKAKKLERFLQRVLRKKKFVYIARRDVTIYIVSKKTTEETQAKQYEVSFDCSSAGAQKFISSLFRNGLIPEGKEWTVYCPLESRLDVLIKS